MASDITNTANVIDVRDIIERYEELENQLFSDLDEGEKGERFDLSEFLSKLRGEGGDEEWRGDWYPLMLINDDYFENYAQELAEELDLVPSLDSQWPINHISIDWHSAAEELQVDYTDIDYDGVTWWYR